MIRQNKNNVQEDEFKCDDFENEFVDAFDDLESLQ